MGPNSKLRDSFAITQVYCMDMLSARISFCTENMNLFHQGLLYHNRGSLSPTSTYKFCRLISIYLFIYSFIELVARFFRRKKLQSIFPVVIYVLLSLVCNVKVGQARARAAQGIGVRFSQEWQQFKGWMEGGVNCIFIYRFCPHSNFQGVKITPLVGLI